MSKRQSDSSKDNINARNTDGPVRVELALIQVLFDVTRDNLSDYFAKRAEIHQASLSALSKPDGPTDNAYAHIRV